MTAAPTMPAFANDSNAAVIAGAAPCSPVRRVQLSRRKGWRKPENTVVTSKPTMWGNPFWKGYGCRMSAAWSYRVHLETELLLMRLGAPAQNNHMRKIAEHLHELRGKNLACWCPLDMPDCYCHAGVLLDLANAAGEATASADVRSPDK